MLKIEPKDVARLIRKARRSGRLTLRSVAEASGVSLSTVQRYESDPNPATARVVSVLAALGFEIAERNGEIRLPVSQARALRRLLREVREGALNGNVSPGVILALEEVNTTGAGGALVRALREREEEP